MMKLKTYPKEGDKRTVIKFALFPTVVGTCDGGELIWLEKYKVYQVYVNPYWEGLQWHTVKTRRMNKNEKK